MSPFIKAAVILAMVSGAGFVAWLGWAIVYGMLYGFYTPVDSWTNNAWAWTVGILFFIMVLAIICAVIGVVKDR